MTLTEEDKMPETCMALKEGTAQEGFFYLCECLIYHPRTTLSPCQLTKGHSGMHKSVAAKIHPATGEVERWWMDWPLDRMFSLE